MQRKKLFLTQTSKCFEIAENPLIKNYMTNMLLSAANINFSKPSKLFQISDKTRIAIHNVYYGKVIYSVSQRSAASFSSVFRVFCIKMRFH